MQSNFAKNFIMVVGGTAFAQIFGTLISPIITRLYTPEDYGVLTIYTAILTTLSLSGFSYEKAIAIADDEDVAINVMALSMVLLMVYTLGLFFLVFFFSEFFLGIFNSTILNDFRFFIPLGVMLTGIYKILQQWAYRYSDFKAISQTTITQSLYGNTIKIVGGLLSLNSLGLILGRIVSKSAGTFKLLKYSQLMRNQGSILSSISLKRIIYVAKRYINFPLFSAPLTFIHKFDQHIPIVFIASFFGSDIVGFYGLAYSITKLPSKLIGTSIGNVFYAEAANIGKLNPERIQKLSNNITYKLALVGLIPFTALIISGPQLFSLVFGNQWADSGIYARIISIMVYCHLVFSPITRAYDVYEKQRLAFLINIIKTFLIILVFLLANFINLSAQLTILIYSITMSIFSIVNFISVKRILSSRINLINP